MSNFTPKPRPQHGPQHVLEQRHEAILAQSRSLGRNYKTVGSQVSNDTIMLPSDPMRTSIPVAKAAMLMRQFALPIDHPNYPPMRKFNSTGADDGYYVVYSNGPMYWQKDDLFRHIPCYSRYVIDRYGRVLNAASGAVVERNKWDGYDLCSDGPAGLNNPFGVKVDVLMALAWMGLPDEFIDYGMGSWSHYLGVDTDSGQMKWLPHPKVKVRNSLTGETKEWKCLAELVECDVTDYKIANQIRPYIRKGIHEDVVTVENYMIKLSELDTPMPPLPAIAGNGLPVEATAAPVEGAAPAPVAQPATAAVAPPPVNDINFEDLNF